MIRLEAISGKKRMGYPEAARRRGAEKLFAPNDVSIIEAYIAITHHGHAFPFGIYDGDTPVGFCMIGFGTDDEWEDAPAIARNSYHLWRFMIGYRYYDPADCE